MKPQYEADKRLLRRGVLPADCREAVLAAVRGAIDPRLRLEDEAAVPFEGSGGNVEVWWKLVPVAERETRTDD